MQQKTRNRRVDYKWHPRVVKLSGLSRARERNGPVRPVRISAHAAEKTEDRLVLACRERHGAAGAGEWFAIAGGMSDRTDERYRRQSHDPRRRDFNP